MSRTAGTKNRPPIPPAALVFIDEDVPKKITRATTVTPYAEFIAPLAAAYLADPEGEHKAKGFDLPLENVEQTLRLLGIAGRDAGVTVRKSVVYGDVTAHVTFWLAPMQHRTRVAK
jgi:hypothetical protein